MGLGIFGKKPRSYLARNPSAAGVYNSLRPEQRKVLDEISFSEQGHASSDEKTALQKIADGYLAPIMIGSSSSQIKAQAKHIYATALKWLASSELTTNVNVSMFMNEAFLNGAGVKTIWNAKTIKGLSYSNTRQKVEENAFGYTIDWSVPVSKAAETRPVYAGLNYTRHSHGAAPSYGSVVLVYKPTLMHRCTFITKDTFDSSFGFSGDSKEQIKEARKQICTSAQLGTLIANLGKSQLKALCDCCTGRFVMGDNVPDYIEAHIHGGSSFSSDLAAIRIATTGASTFDKELGFFEKKHNRNHTKGAMEYLIRVFADRHGVSARYYDKNRVVGVIA